MDREELYRKVRLIEITTRKIVTDALTGEYRSHFKGSGMQFSDHRIYAPGDDIRHLDWKASARSKEVLIKRFEEERELGVFLVVDVSGSEEFGSVTKVKREIAAEVSCMLAYAAQACGDKVGALLFAGEVEKALPPKKGRANVLRIIHELLSPRTVSKGTNLSRALRAAGRLLKHAGVLFVVSDFLAEGFETELKRLSRRHDVIAIWIQDPRERTLPQEGVAWLEDPESGNERVVDFSSYRFREWFKTEVTARRAKVESILKSSGVEILPILAEEDYPQAIVRFFRKRSGRS